MILLEVVIVILAATAAWFYPAYGSMLPAHIDMGNQEAHLLAAYLLVIGSVFVVSRRRKRPPIPPAPTPKSPPPAAKP